MINQVPEHQVSIIFIKFSLFLCDVQIVIRVPVHLVTETIKQMFSNDFTNKCFTKLLI